MVSGIFSRNMPFIPIEIGWDQNVQRSLAVLDTGFTGELQIPRKIVDELGLQIVGFAKAKIANGTIIETPVVLIVVAMNGSVQIINALVNENLPLAGIGFLMRFSLRAVIDCRKMTVELENSI